MLKAKGNLYLILICLVHIGFFLLNNPGPPSTDDKIYFDEAVNILEGDWQLNESPKNHRFGIILPVAALIAVFGDSPHILAIWPLLFSLATIVLLYVFLKKIGGIRMAVIGASFLALSLCQLIYASALFPDVIISFFFLLIPVLLFSGISSAKNLRIGVCAGLLFLPALFVRENILFILPAIGILFLATLSISGAWKMFAAFFASAAFSILVWILTFYILSGDALFVYNTVESQYSLTFASPVDMALLERLIFEPPGMFFRSLTFLPLILLSAPVFLSLLVKRKPLSEPVMWWTVFFIGLLLTFWAGTTSLNQYSLLLMLERLWLPLVPVLCVLASFALEQPAEITEIKFRRRTIFFFCMLIMIFSLFYVGWERFIFYLAFIVCLEGAWYGVQQEHQKRNWELLVLVFPFLILACYLTITNSRFLSDIF